MYAYIIIYPSHFNCLGMISVVSSPDYEPRCTGLMKQSYHGPQTFTRSLSQGVWPARLSDLHVKRIVVSQNGAGATWYWSDQEVSMIVLESKNGNKGTLHQKSDNNFCATHTLRMRISSITILHVPLFTT